MSIKITENNKDEIQKLVDEALERGLEACGLQAENYAARLTPVDTGLLRNSIISAVSGKEPTKMKYVADKPKTKKGEKASGKYTGQEAMSIEPGRPYVLLGTNVKYAPKIELDHKAFIRPALENHVDHYKRILEGELKNG